jgi:hypothetical protein
VAILDETIRLLFERFKQADVLLASRLPQEDESIIEPKIPVALTQLYTGTAAEIRQMIEQKKEILGEEPEENEALLTWVDLMTHDLPGEEGQASG